MTENIRDPSPGLSIPSHASSLLRRFSGNLGVRFVRRALPRGWLCMGCRKSHTPCTLVDFSFLWHVACPMVDPHIFVLNGDLTTFCIEPKTTGSLWYVALNSLTLDSEMIHATAALFFGPQLFQSSTWSPCRRESMETSQEVLQTLFAKRTRHGSIQSTKRYRQRYFEDIQHRPP